MKAENENEELLVGYLLGNLSEEDMIRVEERLFTSDEYYGRFLAVEDDLRYDYIQGRLSERERLAFEKRFLPFAEDRRKLDFASAMLTKTAEIAEAKRAGTNRRKTKTFGESLIALFTLRRPVLAFASAIGLIALAVSIWLAFEMARMRERIEQLQVERATREQQLQNQAASERARADAINRELDRERQLRSEAERELADSQEQFARNQSGRLPSIVSFALAPGRTRAGNAPTANIKVPEGADRLELRLSLNTDTDYRSFRVAILNADGEEVWSRSGLRARGSRSGKMIFVSLPARLLAEDDYELKLSGENSNGPEPVAAYYFTIRQK